MSQTFFSRNVKYAMFIVAILVVLSITLGNALLINAKNGGQRMQGAALQKTGEFGATLIFFQPQPGLRLDNKTHFVFLFYTTCSACEDTKNLYITKSYPAWMGNLTYDDVSFDTINYYRKKDIGEAYFKSFNITKSQVGGTVLVVHNSKQGLVYYPPINDTRVQEAAYYLAKGSVINPVQTKNEVQFSQPLVYALGAVSGFNPCLVALASFFFATATKTELKTVAKRIGLISLGLVYAYIVFFSLIVSNPTVMSSLSSLTWLIAIILAAMGLLHFVEVGQDVYSRRWGSGSSLEAKIPLFKTPKPLKDFLGRSRNTDSPVYDFTLGALFSLIKLPCVALFAVVLLINSATPLSDIMIFTLGVVSPMIAMGLLIGLGMIKVNRLSTLQFKGRLLQRTIIGAALLISAVIVLATV